MLTGMGWDNLPSGWQLAAALVLWVGSRRQPPQSRLWMLFIGSLFAIVHWLTLGEAAGNLALALVFSLPASEMYRMPNRSIAASVLAFTVVSSWYIAIRWLSPNPDNPVRILGISYISFKMLHLAVDLRKQTEPISKLSLITWLLFGPTFRVGPMQRYQDFALSLQLPVDRLVDDVVGGGYRIALGVAKIYVFAVFLQPLANDWQYNWLDGSPWLNILITGSIYTFFLYFDFSGYIDMATGMARLAGIRVPEDFKAPIGAVNISQFWHRWHSTLSSILREYIFLPTVEAINRHVQLPRLPTSIAGYFVTFCLSGFWHGFSLNFQLWALWNAFGVSALAISRNYSWPRIPLAKVFAATLTFFYVSFGWMFFANSTSSLLSIWQQYSEP